MEKPQTTFTLTDEIGQKLQIPCFVNKGTLRMSMPDGMEVRIEFEDGKILVYTRDQYQRSTSYQLN